MLLRNIRFSHGAVPFWSLKIRLVKCSVGLSSIWVNINSLEYLITDATGCFLHFGKVCRSSRNIGTRGVESAAFVSHNAGQSGRGNSFVCIKIMLCKIIVNNVSKCFVGRAHTDDSCCPRRDTISCSFVAAAK